MPLQLHITSNFNSHATTRLEALPLGDSQMYPDVDYRPPEALIPVEESHLEPAVTALSMSLQWERLLAYEKRRNRNLVTSLQEQLQQAV